MPSSPLTGLDEFFDVLREVRKIALVAAGGLILLPVLAGIGGYVPPWPAGIVGITSLVELVALIVAFQLLSRTKRATASRVIVWSAVLLLILSTAYLILNVIFVYPIPNNTVKVVLGCGLSEKTQLILSNSGFQSRVVCPGEFSSLLASAQYETDVVWSKLSVSLIKAALALSWLGAFGALAALTGVFVSFQRRQRVPTAKSAP
ncbi:MULTISPECIES: hypothetical protein [unclassified Polaromonas]|jgi:hypothetical protein|uniref:hypothetical protein n=1 Tax=unclassified Polaromonas TaxID=2638319 RepID=UPI0025CF8678|nr:MULTISPECIES: hypothetical protein [unclassified Polaromonas]HQR98198.1 hypothetical protein [Polaromonas sp.]HQS38907.1 hypothetical protein [Polaromonas sp.]HQS88160.1 hypothetical protein [Polaromonas sp.]